MQASRAQSTLLIYTVRRASSREAGLKCSRRIRELRRPRGRALANVISFRNRMAVATRTGPFRHTPEALVATRGWHGMLPFCIRTIPKGKRAPAAVPGDLPNRVDGERSSSFRKPLLCALNTAGESSLETSTPRGRGESYQVVATAITSYVI
ncbi:Hypothetical predicted protein [Marmota monax]|uniref:Uncharacterized protein n=1 Tax=Marmota monax TaxID=9995 RepID=A0A5E4B100_MARMO|nr:Hypothetical predicted protein [Marmota monax]